MQWATVFSGESPWRTSFLAPFEATFANSVLTGPGQSTVTEIPLSLSSALRAQEKLKTKAFDAP